MILVLWHVCHTEQNGWRVACFLFTARGREVPGFPWPAHIVLSSCGTTSPIVNPGELIHIGTTSQTVSRWVQLIQYPQSSCSSRGVDQIQDHQSYCMFGGCWHSGGWAGKTRQVVGVHSCGHIMHTLHACITIQWCWPAFPQGGTLCMTCLRLYQAALWFFLVSFQIHVSFPSQFSCYLAILLKSIDDYYCLLLSQVQTDVNSDPCR